jgi:hypothetical protein
MSEPGFDLAEWSAPLIADRIAEFYELRARQGQGRREDVPIMARAHCRLWASLLKAGSSQTGMARRDLVRLARATRIEAAELDALDHAILDDLMDVVIGRFARSRGVAHAYGMAIVSAASTLAEARLAA